MIALTILFGWAIILNGSGFAAMQGGVATDLGVPGSILIPYIPWISLIIYIFAVIVIRRDKKVWRRWASFVIVTILCNTIIGYPIWIYNRNVHRISLSSEPSGSMRSSFESRFQVKAKWYSNSSEGDVVAVSNADFSDEMESYIKLAEQDSAPNPLPAE
jgi:hypothetical protein